jgi:hypothetical protein
MSIQVPKTIKKISNDVRSLVRVNYPNVMSLDDIPNDIQTRWFKACGEHELFHQDVDRYIGDIYTEKAYSK